MSTPDILLYQYEISPYADKVRRALHYKGVPYRVREVLPSQGPKLTRISPTGKFPAIEHAGRIIVDSTDIIRYVDETFDDPPLFPADPRARAMAHIIEDWADESLYFYDLTMRGWPHNVGWLLDDVLRYEKAHWSWLFRRLFPRVVAKITRTQGIGRKSHDQVCTEARRHFEAADALAQGGGWLVGEGLSVADIAVASMCFVLARAQEAKAAMDSLPALTAWRQRVDAATLSEQAA